jgi:hypothetical protein
MRMDSKDECSIISDEHFGQLFIVLEAMSNQPLFLFLTLSLSLHTLVHIEPKQYVVRQQPGIGYLI